MVMNGPLQRARAFDARRPLLWDVTLALVVGLISVNAVRGIGAWGAVPLALLVGAVVVRRRRPAVALALGASGVVLGVAIALLDGARTPWAPIAVWVVLFSAGQRVRGRRGVVAALGVVVLVVAAETLVPTVPFTGTVDQLRTSVAVLATSTTALLLGLQVRARRDQLRVQREEAARTAVVAERSRIAQEMHDIIGHNLSVITSLANGGAVAARTSPDDAARAFEAIGAVSRSSVRDVARVLSVLRHDHTADGASLTPQPALADVVGLVASTRSAGVPVTVTQGGDLTDLSAARQLAVYRIVQESLTNVMRHASRGAGARVTLVRDGGDVVVTVDDDGGPGAMPTSPGGGHGILGMRERAEAFGGSLDAGPHGQGWRVRARLRAGSHEGE